MQDWKLAVVVGCVALGGVVVGAECFGARPAQAQTAPPTYARCIVARQESLDTHDDGQIEGPGLNRTILIPSGWEVVGGGGIEGTHFLGSVLLCRR